MMRRIRIVCLAALILITLARAIPLAQEGTSALRTDGAIKIYGESRLRYFGGIPFLKLAGTNREMGLAYGALLRDELRQSLGNIDRYRRALTSWLPWYARPFSRIIMRLTLRNMARRMPEPYAEELAGVAEGAGLVYEDLLFYAFGPETFSISCSSILSRLGERVVLARNLDYAPPSLGKFPVVIEFAPVEGHRFVSVGLIGYLGVLTGVNEYGIGVALNAVNIYKRNDIAAMPVGYKARQILETSSNLAGVDRILEEYRTEQGWTLTVSSAAERDGAIYDLAGREIKRNGMHEADSIFATNAFYDESLCRRYMTVAMAEHPAIRARCNTLSARLGAGPLAEIDDLIDILAGLSFDDYDDALGASYLTVNNGNTLQTIILDPGKGRVVFASAPGYAGLGPFYSYDLVTGEPSLYRQSTPVQPELFSRQYELNEQVTFFMLDRDYRGLVSMIDPSSPSLSLYELNVLVEVWRVHPECIDPWLILEAGERLLDQYPAFVLLYLWKAEILLELDQIEKAIGSLEQSLALPVNYGHTLAAAHSMLACAHHDLGDPAEAAAHARQAMELIQAYALGETERKELQILRRLL